MLVLWCKSHCSLLLFAHTVFLSFTHTAKWASSLLTMTLYCTPGSLLSIFHLLILQGGRPRWPPTLAMLNNMYQTFLFLFPADLIKTNVLLFIHKYVHVLMPSLGEKIQYAHWFIKLNLDLLYFLFIFIMKMSKNSNC